MIVSPFNNRDVKYNGRVEKINPMVDKNGQITVKARIQNNSNSLMDGMNVSVRIENSVDNMFVMPKSAVVIRDNLEVVFHYNNGRAIWTYVNIVMSNSDTHAIIPNSERNAVFADGDIVIVDGNFNLAYNSEFEVR